MATTINPRCLAELLRNYAILHDGRRLWLATGPADAWRIVLRQGLKALGGDWLAVVDKDGRAWAISDEPHFARCKNVAHELPSVAPLLVLQWAAVLGEGAFDVSPGWMAGAERMAKILPNEEPTAAAGDMRRGWVSDAPWPQTPERPPAPPAPPAVAPAPKPRPSFPRW